MRIGRRLDDFYRHSSIVPSMVTYDPDLMIAAARRGNVWNTKGEEME